MELRRPGRHRRGAGGLFPCLLAAWLGCAALVPIHACRAGEAGPSMPGERAPVQLSASEDSPATVVEGVVAALSAGPDAGAIDLRTDAGATLHLRSTPNLDGLPEGELEEFRRARLEEGAVAGPRVLDRGCRVRARYLPSGSGGGRLVAYRVLSRPRVLWVLLLGSHGASGPAEVQSRRLWGEGMASGIYLSRDLPGLRPGFFVVVGGAWTSKGDALAARDRALEAGVAGSCVRKVEGAPALLRSYSR